mgnify:CR=1 FL=1
MIVLYVLAYIGAGFLAYTLCGLMEHAKNAMLRRDRSSFPEELVIEWLIVAIWPIFLALSLMELCEACIFAVFRPRRRK